MPGIEWISTLDNRGFISSMNEMSSQIRRMKASMEAMGMDATSAMERMSSAGDRFIGTLRNIGAIAGVTFSVAQAKSFVDKIAETRAYFQDIESSMKVFLGSEKAASDFTNKLKDYAYYNMFEFSDLANASKQMIAYKHNVEDIIPRLDQLSNVARGTNAPLMEMVNAYNKAKNLGGLDGRDLQSWAAKGLIVKDILKEMGETVQGNRVSFEQLNKVLDKVTGEGGMFHNLMGEQMNNISAEQGQLEDTLASMYNELGEKYQDTIVKWYKMNSEIADNFVDNTSVIMDAGANAADFLIEHYKEIGSVMLRLIAVYGEWRASLIAVNAIKGAQQSFLKEEEIRLLDEAIAKEKKGYEDVLALKERAKNADLAESVAKGELTEKQAALIAAKREELEQLQVDKETIDIDRQINELKSRELELDLQDKVASDQLTLAQAKEIQQRRDMLKSLDEEIRKRREAALAKSEQEINWIEAEKTRIRGEYSGDVEKRDSYNNRIAKYDKEIASLKELGTSEEYISELEEKRNSLAKTRDDIQERINQKFRELDELDRKHVKALEHEDEIVLRYGDKDARLNVLKKQLETARDEEAQAKKTYETVRKHREEEEGKLRLMKEQLEKQKEINRTSEGGEGFSDLSELTEQVEQQQAYVDTLNNSINKKKEDALAMDAQTASEKAKNIQTKIDNVQTGVNANVTKLSTKAKVDDIMAMKGLTLAEKIHLISLSSSTTASKIFTIATLQVKEAIRGLGAALMTNPLGVFLGALTIGLPWLMEWVSGTDDAADVEKKYGNEAKEAETKVKDLVNVLDTANESSKAHKDAVRELTSIYKEYGIEIDACNEKGEGEKNLIDELKNHHEELIAVLRQEAIERQLLNGIEEAKTNFENGKSDAAKEYIENLNREFSDAEKRQLSLMVSDEDIEKAAEILKKYEGMLNTQDGIQKLYREFVSSGLLKTQEEYARLLGVSDKATNNLHSSTLGYLRSLGEKKIEEEQNIDAERRAAQAATNVTEAHNEAARKIRFARMTVTELKKELKELAEQRNINIDVNITYNETNPMPAVLRGYTSDQWKKRQAQFLNLAEKHKNGAKIYDWATGETKYMTQQQLLEESARSGNQSSTVKASEDAAKAEQERLKEESEKNADKRRREAEKAATDAANRRQKLAEIERRERERQEKQARDAEDAATEARIASIKDDAERELAEREYQHEKRLRAIKDMETQMKKAIYDYNKSVWETNNTDKTRHYEDTPEGKAGLEGIRSLYGLQEQRKEIVKSANDEIARMGFSLFDEKSIEDGKDTLDGIISQLNVLMGLSPVSIGSVTTNEIKENTERSLHLQGLTDDDIRKLNDGTVAIGDVEDALQALKDKGDIKLSLDGLEKAEDMESVLQTILSYMGDINASKVAVSVDTSRLDGIPSERTITLNVEQLGDVELPQDATFTVTARYDGDELDKLDDIPSNAEITISTKLGDIEMPDIPKSSVMQVTTDVDSTQYDEMVRKFGEESVKRVDVEVSGDDIPEVADDTVKVTVFADATQLDELKASLPRESEILVHTVVGDVDLPKIPAESTIDVMYDVDYSQLLDAKEAMPKDSTIKYNVLVDGMDAIAQSIPKDTEIVISTRIGEVETPNIPKEATIEVTTKVNADEYNELVRDFGEDAVKMVDVAVSWDGMPDIEDKNVLVTVNTDASQLDALKEAIPSDSTIRVSTKVGEVDMPKLPKDSTITYNVESSQVEGLSRSIDDIAAKLKELGVSDAFMEAFRNGNISAAQLNDTIKKLTESQGRLNAAQSEYDNAPIKLNDKQEAQLRAATIKENEDDKRFMLERMRDEAQAMRSYFKEYGSLEQQRLAIIEEYDQRIQEAKTEGDRLILERQKEQTLANMSLTNITGGIDWRAVFNGVENMTTEMMGTLSEQLKAWQQTQEYKDADAGTKQQVAQMLADMRQYLGSDMSVTWQTLATAIENFEDSVTAFEDAQKAEKPYVQAYEQARKAEKDAADKLAEMLKRQGGGDKGITDEDIERQRDAVEELSSKTAAAAAAMKPYSEATANAKDEMENFGNVVNTTSNELRNYVSKASSALMNATTWQGVDGFGNIQSAIDGFDNLEGTLKSVLGDGSVSGGFAKGLEGVLGSFLGEGGIGGLLGGIGSGVTGVIGIVAQIPRLILQLADTIKNFVTDVLDSVTELLRFEWLSDLVVSILDAVVNVVDAIFDLPESIGNLFANIVVDGIGGMLDGVIGRVTSVFGIHGGPSDWLKNSNEKEVAEITETLTKSNEALGDRVDRLSKVMQNQYGAQSIYTYKEALEAQKKLQEQNMEILRAQMGYHSAHHSNAYYASDSKISAYNSEAQRAFKAAGVTASTISGLSSIYSLTPEQLKAIKDFAPDLWNYLTTVGKYDKSEYWESVVEQAGKTAELTEQIRETLTTTTEDNIFSNFLNDLYQVADGSEDVFDNIAKGWQEMVNKMVINNLIGAKFQERLKDWYTRLADVNEQMTDGKMTEDEYKDALDNLQAEYEREFKKAQADVEHFRDVGIIKASDEAKNEDKNATNVMAEKATYEQFETYLGIATAQQIALEQIKAILQKWDGREETQQPVAMEVAKSLQSNFPDYGADFNRLAFEITEAVRTLGMDAGEADLSSLIGTYIPSGKEGDTVPRLELPTMQVDLPTTEASIMTEQGRIISQNIAALHDVASSYGMTTAEIRRLIETSNEYLLDIRKSNREILSAMTTRLDNMNNLIEKKL